MDGFHRFYWDSTWNEYQMSISKRASNKRSRGSVIRLALAWEGLRERLNEVLNMTSSMLGFLAIIIVPS